MAQANNKYCPSTLSRRMPFAEARAMGVQRRKLEKPTATSEIIIVISI